MYCGDDVSSVVVDVGSFNYRAGYSGEDTPRCVFPSQVGHVDNDIIIGSTEMAYHRPEMKMGSIFAPDGAIDFDILD